MSTLLLNWFKSLSLTLTSLPNLFLTLSLIADYRSLSLSLTLIILLLPRQSLNGNARRLRAMILDALQGVEPQDLWKKRWHVLRGD
ncbi:hypothetical protein BT96DRAFT_930022 [Gymnopus androsaceus JB14]|uniref:Uncharacterized protein n=1 Tax=Gymnopus androsaceus JB14 TaxID=1447944 RepID=A0A6A4GC58_9AGAR|nr:hypothetical protein BT96DRAFT_930022 [Gymnopus androsaceus JB14]